MTENVFTRVKCYMKSQSFVVNDSWLSECVEYYINTNPRSRPEAVQKFVQEQFLLSDLRETNNINGCLPSNLAQQKKTTLSGKYTLQLLKLYDISVSKFKQLEKIRNVSVDNIEATKIDKPQSWEPTGKRMLQLFLTDGIQDILAIEYKPIRILNDSLYPGLKIMIIGPVTCRRGVILLEETNVSLKGGEVDDLLIPNALENVLAKALNMPVNEDPYNDVADDKKQEIPDFEDDFNINLEEIEMIERSEETTTQRGANSNQNLNEIEVNNFNQNDGNSGLPTKQQNRDSQNTDEFPDDDDAFFEDIEMEEIYPSDTNDRNTFKAPAERILKFDESKPSSSSKPLEFPDDDFDLADVDFDLNSAWNVPENTPQNDESKSFNSKKKESAQNVKKVSDPRQFCVEEVITGNKRTASHLSPLPAQSKFHCSESIQQTNKVNRKITDFLGSSSAKETIQERLPPKVCDLISDVVTIKLTEQPIRRTVKGKVKAIGKLTKKNMLWILNGTIADETGSLDVDFSSQFMENLLGLTVAEFSQRKKKCKTDPREEEELRTQMLDRQTKLQALDSLMELEMKKGAKPVVISYSELSQKQKNDYYKRLRMLKS